MDELRVEVYGEEVIVLTPICPDVVYLFEHGAVVYERDD